MAKYQCNDGKIVERPVVDCDGCKLQDPCKDNGGIKNELEDNNPLSQMTKTEIENQDFSWQNIGAFAVVLGVAVLVYKIFKNK
jgi:hypothetical protein